MQIIIGGQYPEKRSAKNKNGTEIFDKILGYERRDELMPLYKGKEVE